MLKTPAHISAAILRQVQTSSTPNQTTQHTLKLSYICLVGLLDTQMKLFGLGETLK